MATKEKNLQPPAVPGPDATEAEMREFEQAKRDYEEQRVEEQVEAAKTSPQTQD
jgi:hypothetical protein